MKSKMISLLLPTRGRREQCLKFLNSIARTTTDLSKVEVVICVDDDDPDESHNISHQKVATQMLIRKKQSMGQYNTDCLKASKGDIIFLVNDDIEVQTTGWDKNVLQMDLQYPDGIYLAYPNDMFKKEKQPTFPIVSKKMCDLMVDPFPSTYKGSFIEYHLLDIFKRLEKKGFNRIHFLKDTIFEHRHYRLGKGIFDETYKNRDRFGDDMVFIGENDNRKRQVTKILNHIIGKEVPVDMLLRKNEPTVPLKKPNDLFLSYMLDIAFLDRGIPNHWRFFLLWWFPARFLAKIFKKTMRRNK